MERMNNKLPHTLSHTLTHLLDFSSLTLYGTIRKPINTVVSYIHNFNVDSRLVASLNDEFHSIK